MVSYYNEICERKAERLKQLIAEDVIAPGDVDTRSISDVQPEDLQGYDQCHFFAGIGGWAYALRLAGCEGERPVWTGSCPCQPFSTAGSKRGGLDKRHLWPTWSRLIEKRRPPIVFGEQVKSAIAFGWMDETFSDLEDYGYACGAAVLPALCGQKGHERQRLWFVAHPEDAHDYGRPGEIPGAYELEAQEGPQERPAEFGGSGESVFLECPDGLRREIKPGVPLLG